MLIAVCADKGSPGATTTALVLGSACPDATVVVEADPAGGDLALRLHPDGVALPETPTVLTVLTATRAQRDGDPTVEHAHVLNSTTAVVTGALLAEQMANAGDWMPLVDALGRRQQPAFLDVGRMTSTSPMLPVAARADLVIMVARPDVASVVRLRERLSRFAGDLARLRGMAPRLMPLLITTTRHGPADVADLHRLLAETPVSPFLLDPAFLAYDPDAVRRLEAGEEPGRRLARTNLLRTARAVVTQITQTISAEADTVSVGTAGGVR